VGVALLDLGAERAQCREHEPRVVRGEGLRDLRMTVGKGSEQ
jgi:hypothetical protein